MAHTQTDPSDSDESGLCGFGDSEDWFGSHAVHRARAIAICNNCPIQRKCALDALRLGTTDGVYAGVFLPGLRDAPGLKAARHTLTIVARGLAFLPEDQQQRRLAIRAASRYAAERHSA